MSTPPLGPVHINIPLDEPLYQNILFAKPLVTPEEIKLPHPKPNVKLLAEIAKRWNASLKKMIICGQNKPDTRISTLLQHFADDEQVVIIAENLAHINGQWIVNNPDSLLKKKTIQEQASLAPDCILSFGGHLVSKHLKSLLRNNHAACHYRIDPAGLGIDTYDDLTKEVVTEPQIFFNDFIPLLHTPEKSGKQPGYRTLWNESNREPTDTEYHVLCHLLDTLPAGSIVHLGNSMPVRHAQQIPPKENLEYHSNRGVSGIDGCLSTAVGTAMVCDKLVLCCLGDLGFIYDSHGLWNRSLPANLRIVVLNNHGGGIFRRLKGPAASPGFEDFFIANHPVNIESLTRAYGIEHLKATATEIEKITGKFLADDGKAKVLEVEIQNNKHSENNTLHNERNGRDHA